MKVKAFLWFIGLWLVSVLVLFLVSSAIRSVLL